MSDTKQIPRFTTDIVARMKALDAEAFVLLNNELNYAHAEIMQLKAKIAEFEQQSEGDGDG